MSGQDRVLAVLILIAVVWIIGIVVMVANRQQATPTGQQVNTANHSSEAEHKRRLVHSNLSLDPVVALVVAAECCDLGADLQSSKVFAPDIGRHRLHRRHRAHEVVREPGRQPA